MHRDQTDLADLKSNLRNTLRPSRRQFLTTMAAAAGASFCGLPRLHADDDPVAASIAKYGGFKLGLQSYSLRNFNTEQAIEHTANLGLHWLEFFPRHYPITDDPDQIAQMNALLEPHKIEPYIHGVNGFGGDAAANRRIFEFAKLAGITLLSANPAPDSFPILNELVDEFDIKVGIHNHGPNHRYDTVEDSLEAVADFDKRIGFCPDTGHYMRSGIDPVEAIDQLKDRLFGMHLKDHERIARDNPPETILGEGAIDLEAFCAKMREIEFDGVISLEYELNPDDPIEDIRKGLANFEAAAKA